MSNNEKMVFVFSVRYVGKYGAKEVENLCCLDFTESSAAKNVFAAHLKNNEGTAVEKLRYICKMTLDDYKELGLGKIMGEFK